MCQTLGMAERSDQQVLALWCTVSWFTMCKVVETYASANVSLDGMDANSWHVVRSSLPNLAQPAYGNLFPWLHRVFLRSSWTVQIGIRFRLEGRSFDYIYTSEHDALSRRGLRLFLAALAGKKSLSLTWFGTVCSSFTVLCRAQSLRQESNGYEGDTNRAFVQIGNGLAAVSALLYLLTALMGTFQHLSNHWTPACRCTQWWMLFWHSARPTESQHTMDLSCRDSEATADSKSIGQVCTIYYNRTKHT